MILEEIKASVKNRLEIQKKQAPLEALVASAEAQAGSKTAAPPVFEQALRKPEMSFICEIKRASPSKGLIAPDFPYHDIAREYEAAGADAVSVLTERDYFMGSPDYLSAVKAHISLPVLRKDFIIDAYQLYESKLLGADAVLLICALLDTETLRRYLGVCDRLGLSALVEAHDDREIGSAVEAGARIIGVNNRDLKTFEVDLQNCIRLRPLVPAGIPYVAESGVGSAADIVRLKDAGVDAVLIGEALMRSPDRKAALKALKGGV